MGTAATPTPPRSRRNANRRRQRPPDRLTCLAHSAAAFAATQPTIEQNRPQPGRPGQRSRAVAVQAICRTRVPSSFWKHAAFSSDANVPIPSKQTTTELDDAEQWDRPLSNPAMRKSPAAAMPSRPGVVTLLMAIGPSLIPRRASRRFHPRPRNARISAHAVAPAPAAAREPGPAPRWARRVFRKWLATWLRPTAAVDGSDSGVR